MRGRIYEFIEGGGGGVAGEEYAIIIVIEVSLSYYVNDKSCYCEKKNSKYIQCNPKPFIFMFIMFR